jgi:hypothetical protein
VQVRNGVHPSRVYLEEVSNDSVGRVITTEIDIAPPPPARPVVENSAYSIWSINLTDPTALYGIGAEINGVKYSTTDLHRFIEFPACST